MHGFHVRSSTLNAFLQVQNISISALQIALPLLFSKRLMPRKTAVTAPQTLVTRSSINFEELYYFEKIPLAHDAQKRLHVSTCRHICVQILQLCKSKLKLSCKTLWPAAMVSTATTPKPFPSISTSSQDLDKPLL